MNERISSFEKSKSRHHSKWFSLLGARSFTVTGSRIFADCESFVVVEVQHTQIFNQGTNRPTCSTTVSLNTHRTGIRKDSIRAESSPCKSKFRLTYEIE